ncbi:hypothetical protein ACFQXA_10065 [Nocardiopsis composta]
MRCSVLRSASSSPKSSRSAVTSLPGASRAAGAWAYTVTRSAAGRRSAS